MKNCEHLVIIGEEPGYVILDCEVGANPDFFPQNKREKCVHQDCETCFEIE